MLKNRQKLLSIAFVVWCVIIGFWLYGGVLKLPFFFDDFVERPYVESLTLSQIWQTAGDLAYFRPLLLTIWKLISFLPGSLSPGLDHALNLLFYIIDALLTGWLAGTIARETRVIEIVAPWLTLDGLRIIHDLNRPGSGS